MKESGTQDISRRMSSVTSLERMLSLGMAAISGQQFAAGATILVYHGIVGDAEAGEFPDDAVRVNAFERQMCFLREKSFNLIPLWQLLSYLKAGAAIPDRTVAVTFDDGYRDTFTRAFPVLQRYAVPATVFLAAAYIGQSGPFPWLDFSKCDSPDARYAMSWNEVKELHAAGIEIGSHTFSHRFMPALGKKDIFYEIARSKDHIEERLGGRVQSFALPFSFPLVHRAWPAFKPTLTDALRESSFNCCCTMLRGHVKSGDNPFVLARLPVGKYDDMPLFRAKLSGCYIWTRFPQYLYQAYFKKYPTGSW